MTIFYKSLLTDPDNGEDNGEVIGDNKETEEDKDEKEEEEEEPIDMTFPKDKGLNFPPNVISNFLNFPAFFCRLESDSCVPHFFSHHGSFVAHTA